MGLLRWLLRSESGLTSRGSSVTDGLLTPDGLASLPSELGEPPASEEARYVQRRIRDNPMWTLDHGTGFYASERVNKRKASLLGTGR